MIRRAYSLHLGRKISVEALGLVCCFGILVICNPKFLSAFLASFLFIGYVPFLVYCALMSNDQAQPTNASERAADWLSKLTLPWH